MNRIEEGLEKLEQLAQSQAGHPLFGNVCTRTTNSEVNRRLQQLLEKLEEAVKS